MDGLHTSQLTRRETHSAGTFAAEDSALLNALTGVDKQTDLVVNRTRRRVFCANLDRDQQKKDRRKQSRMIAVFCLLFLILLTPALWTSIDSFLAGAHFVDTQAQMYLLPLMLFPGIVAIAIIAFKKQQDRESRRES